MRRAETILTNGRIRTMDPACPFAEAVAIGGGRVLAIGRSAEIDGLAGPGTAIHDLHGRAVMPGLTDAHTHGLWGATRDLFECFEGLDTTLSALFDMIRSRLPDTAPGKWIVGGPWRAHARAELGVNPAKMLDEIAPDHPVALKEVGHHSLWLNSAALAAAGIDTDTPDPAGGHIERDAGGWPTGILHETAMSLVLPFMAPTASELSEAVVHMVAVFNRLGLTAFKEPMAFEAELAAYAGADDAGALTVRMAAHLTRSSPFGKAMTPMATLEEWRRTYRRGRLDTNYAKLFLDGVAASRTAAFIEPYQAAADYDPAGHDPDAALLIAPERLDRELIDLDAAGFVVKMHAVGDRAVKAALDAIAAARQTNGQSGLRHEVAHLPFVDPADLPRFAALNAVAEVSPKLWFPNPVTAGQRLVLGDARAKRCHPIGDLVSNGAEIVYGSDWPAAAPDANPWPGIAGMISRRDPSGRFPGALGAEQAIPLETALTIFTRNGARSMGLEGVAGVLSAGAHADLIVLDKPLDAKSPEEIGATLPLATLFEGKVVHGEL